jgi:hypothetical protein
MRKIVVIFILFLAMIGVGVSAASYYQTYLPIVYRPEPTPTQTPTPPLPVQVLPNYSWHINNGYLVITGEVQNNTNGFIDIPKITADIYNSQGHLIDTSSEYTYLSNALAAGDKTFFMLSLLEPPGWSYFKFEDPTYEVGGEPAPDLTIYNDDYIWEPTKGNYFLWATVRNDDIVIVDYSHVIITIYDNTGKVIDGGYAPLEEEYLYPGQESGFSVQFTGQDYSNVTYRLQADGFRR